MGETDEEQQWLLRHLISFESQSTSENDLMIAIPLARSAAVSYLAAPAGQQKYEVPRLKSVSSFFIERNVDNTFDSHCSCRVCL
jgi:hypothetical protein